MRPDLLAYLTPEERAAWDACEAATPGPWWIERDGGDDTCTLVGGPNFAWRDIAEFPFYPPHRHAPDERLIALSRTALPAALTALAEARARVAELEADARMVAEAVMDGGWCSGEGTPDPDCKGPTARDAVATIREFYLFREEVWDAAESSDEEPAPHGAGAPDASGGASGVGVLTNCDSCRHDYVTTTGVHEVHGCRRLDNDDADFDAVSEWSFANCNTRRDARPDPGATGCPGWAKRGEG